MYVNLLVQDILFVCVCVCVCINFDYIIVWVFG